MPRGSRIAHRAMFAGALGIVLLGSLFLVAPAWHFQVATADLPNGGSLNVTIAPITPFIRSPVQVGVSWGTPVPNLCHGPVACPSPVPTSIWALFIEDCTAGPCVGPRAANSSQSTDSGYSGELIFTAQLGHTYELSALVFGNWSTLNAYGRGHMPLHVFEVIPFAGGWGGVDLLGLGSGAALYLARFDRPPVPNPKEF